MTFEEWKAECRLENEHPATLMLLETCWEAAQMAEKQEWIPTSKQLPGFGKVLTYFSVQEGMETIEAAYFLEEGWFSFAHKEFNKMDYVPSHWKPLPEPPKC